MRRKIKTVMEQMNAEKPDDVLADLEAKHGCAAPSGSATYRLLNRSDAMCPGDERLLDDCKTWEVIEPNNPHIGQRYDGNLFVPMRRRSQNSVLGDQKPEAKPGK